MTIWKYPVAFHSTLVMPEGAKLLAVQVQNGNPMLWALVDPLAKKIKRDIRVMGTGWVFDPVGPYVGSFQLDALVFHVFDGGELP